MSYTYISSPLPKSNPKSSSLPSSAGSSILSKSNTSLAVYRSYTLPGTALALDVELIAADEEVVARHGM